MAKIDYGVRAKLQILLFDPRPPVQYSQAAIAGLEYTLISEDIRRTISTCLRRQLAECEVVLIDVTRRSHDVLGDIEQLGNAIRICGGNARLLCFSDIHRNPRFALEIQKRGARFVSLNGPGALLEAVQVMLAEISALERLSFQIIHRFSQGSCAPGEEVAAICLAQKQGLFQLRLGLTQRLLFDFLAQHRQLSLDSLQIVSGLMGDWFYRDHAANSGYRQTNKIRRQTVKVVVQRIREAMEDVFEQAQLSCNAWDVLRSHPAPGTKRTLYRLHGDVRWQHLR